MRFSEFTSINELNEEEIRKSAEEGVEYFNKEMHKLFPGCTAIAKVKQGLGLHVTADFTNLSIEELKTSNTAFMNSTARMTFMLHLSNGFGKVEDMSKFSIDRLTSAYQLRDVGLKYRLISGKSPEEVMKKLVDWFKKNEELIKSVEKKVR